MSSSQSSISSSQSTGLSKRLSTLVEGGRRLNDDSSPSEKRLSAAMVDILLYAQEKCKTIGASISHKKQISLFECQEYFHRVGGPVPDPVNKKVYMKPDGGILMMHLKDQDIPILIVEDKVQGTNDQLHEQNKKRQATGNAIERGAKNIRGSEMLFAEYDIFPYVIFAAGCDFHSSETIAKRLEMMNMGYPNHYVEVTPTSSVDIKISEMIPSINIKKRCGKGIASIFVKAHKWDEMKHGSSNWKKEEMVVICKHIIDQVLEMFQPS